MMRREGSFSGCEPHTPPVYALNQMIQDLSRTVDATTVRQAFLHLRCSQDQKKNLNLPKLS